VYTCVCVCMCVCMHPCISILATHNYGYKVEFKISFNVLNVELQCFPVLPHKSLSSIKINSPFFILALIFLPWFLDYFLLVY
jgi:hypothetical protein